MSKIIGLDAGHGLKTPGKQTPDGIKEWELNDKVRDKIVKLLKDYDVKFVFTDNNEGKIDEGLITRRIMYINKKVDAFVSTHHNAFNGKWNNATGVEVYTDKNPTAKDKKLAQAIYKNLPNYTGLKGRGIKEADFTVINQDKVPAVLIEGGFMDSKNDYKVITSDEGQEAYAKAVAEGLIEFLNLKKKVAAKKTSIFKSYKVKINTAILRVRAGAGMRYKVNTTVKKNEVYTIVDKKNGWGKLKSGAGWISLKYTKKV